MSNSRMLISGSFTKEQLSELESLLFDKNVKVEKLVTKAFETEEVVRIIFQEFEAYQFLRDGVLFELLKYSIEKTVKWVIGKKPTTKIQAKIELRYKEKPINIGGPIENERFMDEVQKTLTIEFLDSVKDGEILNVYWNEKDGEINITKM